MKAKYDVINSFTSVMLGRKADDRYAKRIKQRIQDIYRLVMENGLPELTLERCFEAFLRGEEIS